MDGDFHLTGQPFAELDRRRRSFVDLPWTMTDQQHGVGVVRVTEPGAGDGALGDIAITDLDDVVLGCWVGDCAPLVVIGCDREFAVTHAGWRGLAAGIVDVTIAAFDERVSRVVLGPSIGPCCYEFGSADLAAVGQGVHAEPAQIEGSTTGGGVALDVPAAVRAACDHHELPLEILGGCTGCTYDGFSHRARRDPERHVVAAWRPSSGSKR